MIIELPLSPSKALAMILHKQKAVAAIKAF